MYELINLNTERVLSEISLGFVEQYERLFRNKTSAQIHTEEYRKDYRDFWGMNQARLSASFYEVYFRSLGDSIAQTPTLAVVIAQLYEASTRGNGQRIVPFSFATKLMHMANRQLPIYDSHVAEFYFFEPPTDSDYQVRIAALTNFYEYLIEEYARVLNDGLLTTSIERFRREYSGESWTDEKIIDSLIWAFVRCLHSRQIVYH
jgi:hypothetical protein